MVISEKNDFTLEKINESYQRVIEYTSQVKEEEFSFLHLTNQIDPGVVDMIDRVLDDAVISKIKVDTSLDTLLIYANSIYGNTINWTTQFKDLLDIVAINRIIINKERYDANPRINLKSIYSLYMDSSDRTRDILFLLFVTHRDVLEDLNRKFHI